MSIYDKRLRRWIRAINALAQGHRRGDPSSDLHGIHQAATQIRSFGESINKALREVGPAKADIAPELHEAAGLLLEAADRIDGFRKRAETLTRS